MLDKEGGGHIIIYSVHNSFEIDCFYGLWKFINFRKTGLSY